MPKVTVAIPTYNRKDYLRECIKSVLGQTFQDFQIIVFDNHSDYDVVDFLDEFKDDRISLVSSNKNEGNYNRVFEYQFNSDYVIVFHDDDTMHPELLQQEVVTLDANPVLVWIGTGLRFVKNHDTMFDFSNALEFTPLILDAAGITRLILRGFNLCYDSVMYRSRYMSGVPSYDLYSKWGDRPYLIGLIKNGMAAILRDPLVNYRIHVGQDSQAPSADKAQYVINMFQFYKDQLRGLQTFADKWIFYSYVANNIIPQAVGSARTAGEFRAILAPYRRSGLLKIYYFGALGIYRVLRVLANRIKHI